MKRRYIFASAPAHIRAAVTEAASRWETVGGTVLAALLGDKVETAFQYPADQAANLEHPCDSVPVAVDCKCYIAGAADYQEAHGGFYRRGLEDARMAVINRMLEDGWDEFETACVASAINALSGDS